MLTQATTRDLAAVTSTLDQLHVFFAQEQERAEGLRSRCRPDSTEWKIASAQAFAFARVAETLQCAQERVAKSAGQPHPVARALSAALDEVQGWVTAGQEYLDDEPHWRILTIQAIYRQTLTQLEPLIARLDPLL